jgi:aquaporin Z
MLAQVLGAIFASLTYFFIFKLSMGGPKPLPGFTYNLKPMILEAIFTFALASVVLAVAASKKSAGNSYYGLAIGFTIMTAAFAAGKVSGGAFNPAVGLGTLLVDMFVNGNDISHVWIYIAGPCLGGIIAATFFKLTNPDEIGS